MAALAEVMRQIQRDCEADATSVDSTPFTGRGVGEKFGEILAMLSVVAKAVELLAERVDRLRETQEAA